MTPKKTQPIWLILLEILISILPVLWLLLPQGAASMYPDQSGWVIANLLFVCISMALSCLWTWQLVKNQKEIDTRISHQLIWLLLVSEYIMIVGVTFAFQNKSSFSRNFPIILVGLLFLVLGNLLPKFPPNGSIGIRTKWTLANRENWLLTTRYTARTWACMGLLVWAGILFQHPYRWFLVWIFIASMCPWFFSWNIHRQQLQNGTWKTDLDIMTPETSRTATILSWIVGAIGLLIAGFVIFFGGRYSIQVQPEHIEIQSMLAGDVTITCQDIQAIELQPATSPGSRDFGYAALGIHLGHFSNDEFGSYLRYTGKSPTQIVIRTPDQTYVCSLKTAEETENLFHQMEQSVSTLNPSVEIKNETEAQAKAKAEAGTELQTETEANTKTPASAGTQRETADTTPAIPIALSAFFASPLCL